MKDYSANDAAAVEPTLGWMCARLSRIVAFGFGSGLLRPARGTWGTLLGWLLWYPLRAALPEPPYQGLAIAIAFALGIWACGRAGQDLGSPDHSGMVWDEIVAFWAVLWLIPDTVLAQALGFALFRFFDIVKPIPIAYVDRRLKGGLGVMADDIIAACYTVLVFVLFARVFPYRVFP